MALLAVAIAGSILAGRRTGTAEASIAPEDLAALLIRGDRPPVLDVRSDGEFAAGHVPGAVNVPFNHVRARLADVPGRGDEVLYVYCGHGPRAHLAAAALRKVGRSRIVFVSGHYAGWQRAGLRIER